MQVKLYTIPISDDGRLLDELNLFLRGHKIVDIYRQLITSDGGAYWCFCIQYLGENQKQHIKVDYKNVLNSDEFNRFSKMRELRKKIAAKDAIPAYAVFTDEELSEMAKLDVLNEKGMRAIKGIGDMKFSKYGSIFIESMKNYG